MPVRDDVTVESLVRTITNMAVSPKRSVVLRIVPDDEEQKSAVKHYSNAGYIILSTIGYSHEEICRMFDEAL